MYVLQLYFMRLWADFFPDIRYSIIIIIIEQTEMWRLHQWLRLEGTHLIRSS